MTPKRTVVMILACLAVASLALAQGSPTGTISGRVNSDTGVLPGVTVTVTSPALQGSRTAVTSDNGDFILPLLPPGTYTVVFEMQGFRTVNQTASVAAAAPPRRIRSGEPDRRDTNDPTG